MADEETTQIPGERAETSTGRRIDNNPILKRGAVALAIVAFVSSALWSMRGQDKSSETSQPERVVIRQTADFEPAKEPAQPVAAPPAVQLPTPVLTEEKPADDDKLLDAARRAPVMAYGAEKTQSTRRQQGDAGADPDANYVPLGNTPGSLGGERENEDQRFNHADTNAIARLACRHAWKSGFYRSDGDIHSMRAGNRTFVRSAGLYELRHQPRCSVRQRSRRADGERHTNCR